MEKVFEIYIRTSPEKLWEAISDPEIRRRYTFPAPEGIEPDEFASGETVEVEEGKRRVETMRALWSPEVAAHPETTITQELIPWREGVVGLRVTHGGLQEDAPAEIYGGWPHIVSSLKSLLETGEPLDLRIPDDAVAEWRGQREGSTA